MSTTTEMYNEAERLKDDGQQQAAIEKLNKLLEAEATYSLAHMALAVLYGKVNQHEKAVQHAVRTSELEPDDPFSWTALSVTYQRAFEGTKNQQFIQMAEDAMAKSQSLTGR